MRTTAGVGLPHANCVQAEGAGTQTDGVEGAVSKEDALVEADDIGADAVDAELDAINAEACAMLIDYFEISSSVRTVLRPRCCLLRSFDTREWANAQGLQTYVKTSVNGPEHCGNTSAKSIANEVRAPQTTLGLKELFITLHCPWCHVPGQGHLQERFAYQPRCSGPLII